MTNRIVLSGIMMLGAVFPLSAQGPRHFTRAIDELPGAPAAPNLLLPDSARKGIGNAVLGASLGLVIGVVGGAFGGAAMEGGSCSDQCGLFGAIVGAAVGPTLGVPVGLHLAGANRHIAQSLAISAIVATAGLAVLDFEDHTARVLIVPSTRLLIALLAKR